MSVHQVEQYYIYMKVKPELKDKIIEHLDDSHTGSYGFSEDDSWLSVDDFDSESDAVEMENEIESLMSA